MSICTLTESAKRQIDLLCNQHDCYAISLNLKGGGCAGFEYDWGIIKNQDEIETGDEVILTDNGNRFVIGSYSVMYLIGTEVDYISSLVGSSFEIKNPNAKNSCGCGVSVNFDMDRISHFIG